VSKLVFRRLTKMWAEGLVFGDSNYAVFCFLIGMSQLLDHPRQYLAIDLPEYP
jgi:hypothetical protein